MRREIGDKYVLKGIFLDRIDSSAPYTDDNVVSCCGPCNMTRNFLVGFHEMQVLAAVRRGDFDEAAMLARKYSHEIRDWACKVAAYKPREGSLVGIGLKKA